MNDASVRAIRLPQVRTNEPGNSIARKAMVRLLNNLKIGSLTVHDGGETLTFGSPHRSGEPHAEVRVHNPSAYRKVLTGGALGSGEAYMEGDWSSPALVEVIRLFTANMSVLQTMDAGKSWLRRIGLGIAHALNNNCAAPAATFRLTTTSATTFSSCFSTKE